MGVLNNIGVVITIIGGIFGIVGINVVGIVVSLRGKAASAQRKQAASFEPLRKQSSYQAVPNSLSKLDWMEVLWKGLVDYTIAFLDEDSRGCIITIIYAFVAGLVIAGLSSLAGSILGYISLIVFIMVYITINTLFYVYFVGRRIEEKIEDINSPLAQLSKIHRNY